MEKKSKKKSSVLIMGGSGYLGTHLLKQFSSPEWTISATYFHATPSPTHSIQTTISWLKTDARNPQTIAQIVKNKTHIVLLSGTNRQQTQLDPSYDAMVTCLGTLNILHACLKHNPSAKILLVTSRFLYGRQSHLPVTEKSPTHPGTIYGLHHLIKKEYAQLYAGHNLNTIILTLSGIYGSMFPFINPPHNLINYFIYQAVHNKSISLLDNGNNIRDYLYIEDATKAIYQALISKTKPGTHINIGGSQRTSIKKIANLIIQTAKKGRLRYRKWDSSLSPDENGSFFFDIRTAREKIKWHPTYTLTEGIKKSIAIQENALTI